MQATLKSEKAHLVCFAVFSMLFSASKRCFERFISQQLVNVHHYIMLMDFPYSFCGYFRENRNLNCWLNFDLILTPYKLLNHACMETCVTYALVTCAETIK